MHFHEFVRVACVAVLACELASPIRVDGPREGHPRRVAFVEQGLCGKGKVLDLVTFVEGFAQGRKARDSHESTRWFRLKETGTALCCHSPFIRLTRMLLNRRISVNAELRPVF